jgi:hypothetical protein
MDNETSAEKADVEYHEDATVSPSPEVAAVEAVAPMTWKTWLVIFVCQVTTISLISG